jgi:hypothetical protein
MGDDNDNDPAGAEQRDAPGGEAAPEVHRSWSSVLARDGNQVAVDAVVMALGYGAKVVTDKIRKPPPPAAAAPPPSDSK